jgi:hypothetical protein
MGAHKSSSLIQELHDFRLSNTQISAESEAIESKLKID